MSASQRLRELADLVARVRDLTDEIARKEADIAGMRGRLDMLITKTIPEFMMNEGVKTISLTDGTEVRVKDDIKAGLPKDEAKRAAALAWLRENGHDALITRDIEVSFKRGQDNQAGDLVALLTDRGLAFTDHEGIHPQSYAAWARERMGSGDILPMDVLGLFEYRKAVITQPKKRKS